MPPIGHPYATHRRASRAPSARRLEGATHVAQARESGAVQSILQAISASAPTQPRCSEHRQADQFLRQALTADQFRPTARRSVHPTPPLPPQRSHAPSATVALLPQHRHPAPQSPQLAPPRIRREPPTAHRRPRFRWAWQRRPPSTRPASRTDRADSRSASGRPVFASLRVPAAPGPHRRGCG